MKHGESSDACSQSRMFVVIAASFVVTLLGPWAVVRSPRRPTTTATTGAGAGTGSGATPGTGGVGGVSSVGGTAGAAAGGTSGTGLPRHAASCVAECRTDTSTNALNCGTCATTCQSGALFNGGRARCSQGGLTECSATRVDVHAATAPTAARAPRPAAPGSCASLGMCSATCASGLT